MLRRCFASVGMRAVPVVAAGLFSSRESQVVCAPVNKASGELLALRSEKRDESSDEGDLAPSSPAVRAADRMAVSFGASQMATLRLAYFSAFFKAAGLLDPELFFRRFPRLSPDMCREKKNMRVEDLSQANEDMYDSICEAKGVRDLRGEECYALLPKDLARRNDDFDRIVEAFHDCIPQLRRDYKRMLDNYSKKLSREDPSRDNQVSEDEEVGNHSSRRQAKRKEETEDKNEANRNRKYHSKMLGEDHAPMHCLVSEKGILQVRRAMQGDEPGLPPLSSLEVRLHSEKQEIHVDGTLAAVEKMYVLLDTLSIGQCNKVNEGDHLRPSFGKLRIDTGLWLFEKAPKLEYVCCHPVSFRDWGRSHLAMCRQHAVHGSLIYDALLKRYDELALICRGKYIPASLAISDKLGGVRRGSTSRSERW